MPDFEDLLYEVDRSVAVIRLNRPQALNAFTAAMGRNLRKAVATAVADDGIRVIVLTGAGRGFCAGADMKRMQRAGPSGPQADDPEDTKYFASDLGPDISAHYGGRFGYLIQARKPVIAALNGPAAGLGLVLALYADLRFAGSDAKLTTSFAQRGLIAEHGVGWLLPQLVGPARALDLLLSARKIGAPEAERMGLVNSVFPQATFMDDVMAYAHALAESVSPRSTAVIKAQVRKAPFQSFDEALTLADIEMQKSVLSADFKEGVAHFVEKRAPRFTGH